MPLVKLCCVIETFRQQISGPDYLGVRQGEYVISTHCNRHNSLISLSQHQNKKRTRLSAPAHSYTHTRVLPFMYKHLQTDLKSLLLVNASELLCEFFIGLLTLLCVYVWPHVCRYICAARSTGMHPNTMFARALSAYW